MCAQESLHGDSADGCMAMDLYMDAPDCSNEPADALEADMSEGDNGVPKLPPKTEKGPKVKKSRSPKAKPSKAKPSKAKSKAKPKAKTLPKSKAKKGHDDLRSRGVAKAKACPKAKAKSGRLQDPIWKKMHSVTRLTLFWLF